MAGNRTSDAHIILYNLSTTIVIKETQEYMAALSISVKPLIAYPVIECSINYLKSVLLGNLMKSSSTYTKETNVASSKNQNHDGRKNFDVRNF